MFWFKESRIHFQKKTSDPSQNTTINPLDIYDIISGQIIRFHQPRCPWNKGFHFPSKKATFLGWKSVVLWGRCTFPHLRLRNTKGPFDDPTRNRCFQPHFRKGNLPVHQGSFTNSTTPNFMHCIFLWPKMACLTPLAGRFNPTYPFFFKPFIGDTKNVTPDIMGSHLMTPLPLTSPPYCSACIWPTSFLSFWRNSTKRLSGTKLPLKRSPYPTQTMIYGIWYMIYGIWSSCIFSDTITSHILPPLLPAWKHCQLVEPWPLLFYIVPWLVDSHPPTPPNVAELQGRVSWKKTSWESTQINKALSFI